MLFIEPKHLKIIHAILSAYPYDFYVFGSRSKGNPKPLSDLDLCFFENIPSMVLTQISGDFEESDLPYKVDIVDWNKCSPAFQNSIKNDLTKIDTT